MKNNFWILFSLLIIMSCNLKEKNEEINYPFTDLEISSIRQNPDEEILNSKDSIAINEISSYLEKLSSEDLIKGRRLHGAEKLCNIIIENKTENRIFISISSHKQDGITADFLQEKPDDNFTSSLGRLYNADKLAQLLKNHGLNCDGKK